MNRQHHGWTQIRSRPWTNKPSRRNAMNTDTTPTTDRASHGTARAAREISHAAADAVASIAQPIADVAREHVEQGAGMIQAGLNVVKEQGNRVSRGARDAYRAVKKSADRWEDAAQATIRRMPLTTALVAVGVGMVLGFA